MNSKFDINKKRRERKRASFFRKHRAYLKELTNRFMESENTGAYIGCAVLAMVGLGGILVVGAIAPNIFSAFGRYRRLRDNYDEKQIRRSVYFLRRKGLVKFVKKPNGVCEIKITKQGEKKLAEFSIENMRIKHSRQWDGKWRVVIFDIPERFRAARGALRSKLKELGLFQFQQSVFAYPHQATDEILFIAAFFGVERYIEILTVESNGLTGRSVQLEYSHKISAPVHFVQFVLLYPADQIKKLAIPSNPRCPGAHLRDSERRQNLPGLRTHLKDLQRRKVIDP